MWNVIISNYYFSAGFVVIRVIREKQKRNYKLGIWNVEGWTWKIER
jgi:hypothetical protein